MDILIVIYFLSVIAFLSFVYFLSKTTMGKGRSGEKVVSEVLSKLDRSDYLILNNLKVGKYQIDHIVISIYGIFIIETKNWSGIIYGRGWDYKWKQFIKGKNGAISFPKNPIYQNRGHLYAIQKILPEYVDLPLTPIIVVSGELERHIYKDPCIKISQLPEEILSHKEPLLSFEVRNEIYEKLSKL